TATVRSLLPAGAALTGRGAHRLAVHAPVAARRGRIGAAVFRGPEGSGTHGSRPLLLVGLLPEAPVLVELAVVAEPALNDAVAHAPAVERHDHGDTAAQGQARTSRRLRITGGLDDLEDDLGEELAVRTDAARRAQIGDAEGAIRVDPR